MTTIFIEACSNCRTPLSDDRCPICRYDVSDGVTTKLHDYERPVSKGISVTELHRLGSENNFLAAMLYDITDQVASFDKAAESSREWFNSYDVQVVVMRWAPLWAPILFLLFALFLTSIMHTG